MVTNGAEKYIESHRTSCDFIKEDDVHCCDTTLPKTLPTDCGDSASDRIHGGQATRIDEFPWTALLAYNSNKNNMIITQFSCGGSLINERYVLTGKHLILQIKSFFTQFYLILF